MSTSPQSATTAQPSLWRSVLEAIRGSHQDYTAGNMNRAILLLAIPMVLEMVLESLFAVVDVFWVGRLGVQKSMHVSWRMIVGIHNKQNAVEPERSLIT